MKRTWVKVICLALALALGGAGVVAAQQTEPEIDVTKALTDSYELIVQAKYAQAEKLLQALQRNKFAFLEMCEVLLRYYKTEPSRLRPTDRMVAHTGFLVFGRRIEPSEDPRALDLLVEVGMLSKLNRSPQEPDAVEADGVSLRLSAGGVVRLGAATDVGSKLRAASTVLNSVDTTDVCVIDVRVPAAPSLTHGRGCL